MKFTKMLFVALLTISSIAFCSENEGSKKLISLEKSYSGLSKAININGLRLGVVELCSLCSTALTVVKEINSKRTDKLAISAASLFFALINIGCYNAAYNPSDDFGLGADTESKLAYLGSKFIAIVNMGIHKAL